MNINICTDGTSRQRRRRLSIPCTEIDFWVDFEAVKSTVKNLARGIIRAKKLSQIKKVRKPKIKKKPKKRK